MKNLLLLIALCLTGVISKAATYYVSPTGSDSNPGTLASPFKSVSKLSTVLKAGDIAYIRGGTYNSAAGNAAGVHFLIEDLKGTSASPIKIWAYPGETPLFDCSNITPTNENPFEMMISNCSYVHLKGLTIKNLKQISSGNGVSRGFIFSGSNNCTAELLNVFNIGGTGVTLQNSNGCSFINCDSHHNGDGASPDTWNFGDGFTCTGGDASTDILFDGCRAWMNGDDNWDFFAWAGMKVTIKNCWSFWASVKPWGPSGTQPSEANMTPENSSVFFGNQSYYSVALGESGEGFKLGGFNVGGPGPVGMPTTLKKFLTNCVSFENNGTGYSENMQAQYSHQMSLENCISYRNGNDGFGFGVGRSVGIAHIFKNDWAWNNNQFQSGADWVYDGLSTNVSNNYWASVYGGVNYGNLKGTVTVNASDFQSSTPTGMTAARQSDGSLPVINFLKLVSNSDMIDKGVNVGLPFVSNAPDLGAFEANSGSSNITPTANAGADIAIALPTNSVTLTGSGTDPDGTIASYSWTQVSGPTTSSIINATSALTAVASLGVGAYQFQLKVTDNAGASATDNIIVIVASLPVPPPTNASPTANAGADKTITLPTNSVSVTGTGTDPDGTISAYIWTKISGPAGGTISSATTATTNITSLVQGTYKFEFKVSDNTGATGRDTMQVIVNAAPVSGAPTANAGADKTITLPTNSVNVAGSGTDPNGSISAYLWTKVSGPTGGTIATPTTATITIKSLVQGTYQFELKVTDNSGETGKDTMKVIVNAAPGTPTTDTTNHAYGGVRWAIPGKIEAKNFDMGGQNKAYYDTHAGNNGGAYRTTESVDMVTVAAEANNPIVGWIDKGEWMKYSVNITTSGTYNIEARVASAAAGNAFRIELDGVTIATVNPTNTGGTATWKTITVPNINLTAGNKTMRIYSLKTGGYNINYVNFKQSTSSTRMSGTDSTDTDVTTFPVPFSSSFTVNLAGETTGTYSLTLVDVLGKAVWKKEVNKTSSSVNETIYMGKLPDGIYTLQVISPDQKRSAYQLVKD